MDTAVATRQDDALPRATGRAVPFELTWGRYVACTLRRPPRVLWFELAWLGAVVAAIVAVRADRVPWVEPHQLTSMPLVLLVAMLLLGAVQRIWNLFVTSWSRNGGADRVATIDGSRIMIAGTETVRMYDLARVRCQRVGTYVRLTSRTGRWMPDDVPAALLDGLVPVAVEEPEELAPEEVAFATTWRDLPADLRATFAPRPTIGSAAIAIAMLAVAIAVPIGSASMTLLAIVTVIGTSAILVVVLGPVGDWLRGVIVSPTDEGLLLRDRDYAELMAWSRLPYVRIARHRISVQPYGVVRERAGNRDAFAQLDAAVREHCRYVSVQSPQLARPAWMLVALPLRATMVVVGLVAIAIVGGDASSIASASSSVYTMLVLPFVVFAAPGVVRIAAMACLIRRPRMPRSHRMPPADDTHELTWSLRDLRLGAVALLAAPLLTAGVVLVVAGFMPHGSAALALGLLVALAARPLLPNLRRELALLIAACVACAAAASFLALAAAMHPRVSPTVATGVVAVFLVLFLAARATDRRLVPIAPVGRSCIVAAFVAAAIGGVAALQLVGTTRIDDLSSASSILAHPEVATVSLRGMPLERAYADVERIEVTWDGDLPSVASSTGMFDGRDGSRARRRLEAILRAVAIEPGPRPHVDEIVLAKSWYGVAANHAISEISTRGARWPEHAREWIRREVRHNDWNSRYYGADARIVISRRESANLLADLSAPRWTYLDRRQAYSFHVLRHEIEHGMSSSYATPQWITESAAELLTQWAGREDDVLSVAGFHAYVERRYGSDEYQQWAELLEDVLETCGMSPSDPDAFDDAARLLRDRDEWTPRLLAACLVDRGVDPDGLAGLIAEAGSSPRDADALRARLRAPA